MLKKNRWPRAFALALLVGCSGGGAASVTPNLAPLQPVPSAAAPHAGAGGNAAFTILVPPKPMFVSPATAGIEIDITGPAAGPRVASLVPGAPGCKSQYAGRLCTVMLTDLPSCPTNGNCYTAAVSTYDKVSGCPKACAIPPGAHLLSANSAIPFHVGSGATQTIGLTLDGVPASVVLVPDPLAKMSGSMASGYTIGKCNKGQRVDAFGVDAGGNYVVGAGAPVMTVASSDSTHLSPVAVGANAPNAFTLTSPKLPNGNTSANLTVTATPLSGAGAAAKKAIVAIHFDGAICGMLTEYPIPTANSGPAYITAGPDGAMWFTEFNGFGGIGRIAMDGTVTETVTTSQFSHPYGIAAGPDGNVWFVENATGKVGRVTPTFAMTEYQPPTGFSSPNDIARGPDGAMWFTEGGEGQIGRVTVGNGKITEYTFNPGAGPYSIAAGTSGELYFANIFASSIGRITIGAAPTIATTPTLTGGASPIGVAQGPDGAVWYTENSANRIGRMGQGIGEYQIPTAGSAPNNIVAGPDGAMWFTEGNGNKIGRITTAAKPVMTEIDVPTASAGPFGIAVGPDGAIWFTEIGTNKIGRIQ